VEVIHHSLWVEVIHPNPQLEVIHPNPQLEVTHLKQHLQAIPLRQRLVPMQDNPGVIPLLLEGMEHLSLEDIHLLSNQLVGMVSREPPLLVMANLGPDMGSREPPLLDMGNRGPVMGSRVLGMGRWGLGMGSQDNRVMEHHSQRVKEL